MKLESFSQFTVLLLFLSYRFLFIFEVSIYYTTVKITVNLAPRKLKFEKASINELPIVKWNSFCWEDENVDFINKISFCNRRLVDKAEWYCLYKARIWKPSQILATWCQIYFNVLHPFMYSPSKKIKISKLIHTVYNSLKTATVICNHGVLYEYLQH